MQAATYQVFGSAIDVLRTADIELPAPGAGEVLVDLIFSGVNPSDVKARAGSRPGVTKPAYPVVIPHSDGAGVIRAVGPGVDTSRIGARVWIWNGQWQRAFGTAAQQILLPESQAVALPTNVSFETGACLGIPGLTACYTVFSGGDVTGQTVLVQGGAGTVGLLAVQLAKWGGARVIATASPATFQRVRDAGADVVLDYAASDLGQQVLDANNGQSIDTIIEVEFGANIDTSAQVLAENGRIVAYGSAREMSPTLPFYPLLFKAVTIEIALVYLLTSQQRADTINRLTQALNDGALTCPIAHVFSLNECAAAHQAVETGHRNGAVLVRTNPDPT